VITNWHRALQEVHQNEHLFESTAIHNKLVATGQVGAGTKSEPRVKNIKKLSDKQFIDLIKSTLPEVGEVRIIGPNKPGSKSGSYNTFVFTYDGKERGAVLATGVKGRGAKSTISQEVSWLLVLSALYNDKTIKDPVALEEAMLLPIVYSRVFDQSGNKLDEKKAKKLKDWLFAENNTKWVESHLGQTRDFISKDFGKNTPSKFVKDRPNMPIVQLAKSIFSTSVPDQDFDKDKWNPADVWLEYEDTPSFSTLTQLNNYLEASIKGSKGCIGVSLKLGKGVVNKINMKGKRPEYEVTDFDLKFGDLFAQNVPTEYEGPHLEGYTVTYRVFDASAKSTIRGEAQKKKSLAAHGKVYLKYMDFLLGRGRIERSVEGVKGILVKQIPNNDKKIPNRYEFTKQGERAFKKIKRSWPILRNSDMMEYASTAVPANYDKLTDKEKFLDYLAEYAHKNKLEEIQMQTRVSVRFQTIMLGVLLAAVKKKSVDTLHKIVLGMLLYGKSESEWSAPHTKAQ
tara:strand:- start:471 stop:2003 length:1533 start_codon:yes stop_codon:yes gene_type:complete